jgi:hypothetical protein
MPIGSMTGGGTKKIRVRSAEGSKENIYTYFMASPDFFTVVLGRFDAFAVKRRKRPWVCDYGSSRLLCSSLVTPCLLELRILFVSDHSEIRFGIARTAIRPTLLLRETVIWKPRAVFVARADLESLAVDVQISVSPVGVDGRVDVEHFGFVPRDFAIMMADVTHDLTG